MNSNRTIILNKDERYCFVGPNEIKFISDKQTMSLVLGSCISTVFIGKSSEYILAANHIVVAQPHSSVSSAARGAKELIDEIVDIYKGVYHIDKKDLYCFHLIGAGKKTQKSSFHVPEKNISETVKVLSSLGTPIIYKDTGSYFFGTYSLHNNDLSLFVENKFSHIHLSFTVDLNRLFDLGKDNNMDLSVSALESRNPDFEYLVDNDVVVFITGKKDRMLLEMDAD